MHVGLSVQDRGRHSVSASGRLDLHHKHGRPVFPPTLAGFRLLTSVRLETLRYLLTSFRLETLR